MRQKQLFALGVIIFSSVIPLPVFAQTFNELNIFGDSLVDTGNTFRESGGALPPSPPYFEGRFSNGPIWVETLNPAFNIDPANVRNFSFGGSTTGTLNLEELRRGIPLPGLQDQVDAFVAQPSTPSPDALFVIWAGANDYLLNVVQGVPLTPEQAANNLSTAITRLEAEGGRTFMVVNLPDLGQLPLARQTGTSPAFTNLTNEHNARLLETLQSLDRNRDIEIIPLDINALFNEVAANPARYGFTNITDNCLNQETGTLCPNPDEFLFWDLVHPSARTHQLIGNYATAVINAPLGISPQGEVALNLARRPIQAINARLLALRTTPFNPDEPLGVFVNAGFNFGDRGIRGNEPGYDFSNTNLTAGVDYYFGNDLALGLALGYVTSSTDLAGNRGNVNANGYAISGYGNFVSDNVFVNGVLSYGWNDFDFTRQMTFDNRRAMASAGGNQFSAQVEGGYSFEQNGFSFAPLLGLRYDRATINAYTEQGAGSLNLRVNDQTAESLLLSLGAQIGREFNTGNVTLIPMVRFSYERELLGGDRTVVTELVNQPGLPFRTTVSGLDRDYFRLGVGSQFLFNERFSGSLDYETLLGRSNSSDNLIRGELRYSF